MERVRVSIYGAYGFTWNAFPEVLYNQHRMAFSLGVDGHKKRFLACFAMCGRINEAAHWAKIHRNSHYGWMQEDPEYPARFKQAESEAARMLEDEAVRRAHHGIRKAIRYKGRIVAYDIEYSDTILLALLRANNPDKFTERQKREHSGTVAHVTLADIDRDIEEANASNSG